jgi:hypothetical protein
MASETPPRPPAPKRTSTKTTKSPSTTSTSIFPDALSTSPVSPSGDLISSPQKPKLSFADASAIRGTAEYLATKLTGRGHTCPHFPKYRVEDSKSPYPSRLGFFHGTDANFSYLDTSRLCVNCCADVVPEGYNAWSTFSSKSAAGKKEDPKAGKSDSAAPGRKWLEMPASGEFYPQAFQAGTEGFTDGPVRKRSRFAKDIPVVIAKIIAADPVNIPIPKVAGAKEAWLWLEAQEKPFYIDQLHLTKGWSPVAEKNAAVDAGVAAESGTAYDGAAVAKVKKAASTAKPKKAGTVTGAKKPGSKDVVAGAVEMAAESQSPDGAKAKKPKQKEVVASPVDTVADSQPVPNVSR